MCYFCPVLTKIGIEPQILVKTSCMKFQENHSGQNHPVSRGQKGERMGITSTVIDFRNCLDEVDELWKRILKK
jgi:hypothetical protein